MKKFFGVILAIVMTFCLLSGCNPDSGKKLNVALQTTAQGVPAYIAEKEGYLDEVGVETLSAVYATGVAQLEALGADSWDVACIGAPPALTANMAYDAKIIALVLNESSTEIFVRSDSDILTSENEANGITGSADAWRGKTIILPLNTTSHYIILSALSGLGLGANDINMINMDVGQAYTAFKSGQADAVTLWDPNSFTAADEGWTSVMYGPDTGAVCPCMLVASQKAIDEKPELIKAWLKAYFNVVSDPDFTTKKQASVTYEFFNANDLEITEEEAMLFAARKQFFSLEEAYNLFHDGNGGESTAEKNMYSIAKFFFESGSYTEEDYQKVTSGGLFYTNFVDELYAEANG